MWWCWRCTRPAGLRPDRRRINDIRRVPQDNGQATRHSDVCSANVRGTAPSAASASAERPARTPARCTLDANCRGRARRLRSLRPRVVINLVTEVSRPVVAALSRSMCADCGVLGAVWSGQRCVECTVGVPVRARAVDSAVHPHNAANPPARSRLSNRRAWQWRECVDRPRMTQPSGDDACRSCVAALEWCGTRRQPKRQSATSVYSAMTARPRIAPAALVCRLPCTASSFL